MHSDRPRFVQVVRSQDVPDGAIKLGDLHSSGPWIRPEEKVVDPVHGHPSRRIQPPTNYIWTIKKELIEKKKLKGGFSRTQSHL